MLDLGKAANVAARSSYPILYPKSYAPFGRAASEQDNSNISELRENRTHRGSKYHAHSWLASNLTGNA